MIRKLTSLLLTIYHKISDILNYLSSDNYHLLVNIACLIFMTPVVLVTFSFMLIPISAVCGVVFPDNVVFSTLFIYGILVIFVLYKDYQGTKNM